MVPKGGPGDILRLIEGLNVLKIKQKCNRNNSKNAIEIIVKFILSFSNRYFAQLSLLRIFL